MSKEREVAEQMIEELVQEITARRKKIDSLLEDGEDDYFTEKVHYAHAKIDEANTALRTLRELISRADKKTGE